MSQLTVCIIIFAASLILYAVNVIPMALTSVLTLLAFVLTGCLTPEKALISRGAVISLVLAAVQVFYVMTVFPAF